MLFWTVCNYWYKRNLFIYLIEMVSWERGQFTLLFRYSVLIGWFVIILVSTFISPLTRTRFGTDHVDSDSTTTFLNFAPLGDNLDCYSNYCFYCCVGLLDAPILIKIICNRFNNLFFYFLFKNKWFSAYLNWYYWNYFFL